MRAHEETDWTHAGRASSRDAGVCALPPCINQMPGPVGR